MARTLLGDSRAQALADWDTRLGEMFSGLNDDYARRKLGFQTEIVYTEDFVKTMPELESWFTGMAFVFLSDEGYGRRLESLDGTEMGQIGVQFQLLFEGFMLTGPIAKGHPTRPGTQDYLPTLRRELEKFRSELRRYGLRKRLDYVGGILGLLEGVARGLPEPPAQKQAEH